MNRLPIALLALALLLISGPVLAQDATEPAEDTAPVIIPDAPITGDIVIEDGGQLNIDQQPAPVAEPVPNDDISPQVMWGFVAVVVALLIAFSLVLRPLILQLAATTPAPVSEATLAAVESALRSAEAFAGRTSTPVDNLAVAELRKEFESLRDEIRRLYAAVPPTP